MSSDHPEIVIRVPIDQIIAAIAPCLIREFLEKMPKVAAALADNGDQRLPIVPASRKLRVRPELISKAVRLPITDPGHLEAERRPGPARGVTAGDRFLIKMKDLNDWAARGGPARVAAMLKKQKGIQ